MRPLALLCVAALLAGCSTGDAAVPLPDPVSPPPPTGAVVLRVVDADGDETAWDLEGLHSLGSAEVELFEPFIDADTEFTTVPLAHVLVHSGVEAGQDVRLLALDDYTVTLPLDGLAAEQAHLALAERGEPIPLESGGPIRLVFDSSGEIARNQDNWIWSIVSAEARR